MGKKIYLDIDYYGLCWGGDGSKEQLTKIFDNMAENGFSGAIMDCFLQGDALFHSRHFPRFSTRVCLQNSDRLVANLSEFDPLAFALKLARERKLNLMPYVRLIDEAIAPGNANAFFQAHPEYWLRSRCGGYRLCGFPCFGYEEVREHFLLRISDLAELGFENFYIGALRSHSFYYSPWAGVPEAMRMWGFNPPIAAEYFRRTGVDPTRVGEVVTAPLLDGELTLPNLPQRSISYINSAECDYQMLRRIHGEGMEDFLRSLRLRYPNAKVVFETHPTHLLPGEYPVNATWLLDPEILRSEHLIDELITTDNWRGNAEKINSFRKMIPDCFRFGAWLNDIFSSDGGGGSMATLEMLARYVEQIRSTNCDFVIVHEAQFLESCSFSAAAWRELGNL